MEKTAKTAKASRDKDVQKDKELAEAAPSSSVAKTAVKPKPGVTKAIETVDRIKAQLGAARKEKVPVTLSPVHTPEVADVSPQSRLRNKLQQQVSVSLRTSLLLIRH